jgi:hypothetical protein
LIKLPFSGANKRGAISRPIDVIAEESLDISFLPVDDIHNVLVQPMTETNLASLRCDQIYYRQSYYISPNLVNG